MKGKQVNATKMSSLTKMNLCFVFGLSLCFTRFHSFDLFLCKMFIACEPQSIFNKQNKKGDAMLSSACEKACTQL